MNESAEDYILFLIQNIIISKYVIRWKNIFDIILFIITLWFGNLLG